MHLSGGGLTPSGYHRGPKGGQATANSARNAKQTLVSASSHLMAHQGQGLCAKGDRVANLRHGPIDRSGSTQYRQIKQRDTLIAESGAGDDRKDSNSFGSV